VNIAAVNTDKPIPRHRVLAKVVGQMVKGYEDVLTPDALLFLADLERRFGPQRRYDRGADKYARLCARNLITQNRKKII